MRGSRQWSRKCGQKLGRNMLLRSRAATLGAPQVQSQIGPKRRPWCLSLSFGWMAIPERLALRLLHKSAMNTRAQGPDSRKEAVLQQRRVCRQSSSG